MPAGAPKEDIEKIALATEAFAQFGGGHPVKKVVIVPGRLVNVVV